MNSDEELMRPDSGSLPGEESASGLVSAEEVVMAELVTLPAAAPRVWTALLVGTLAIPLAFVVGGVVLAAGMLVTTGLQGDAPVAGRLEDFTQTRAGLMLVVLPGQLIFLGAALGAAWLSPQTLRDRLSLRRGGLPYWSWLILMLATPIIGVLSSHLLSLVVDEMSEQLKLVEAMMRAHVRDFPVGLIVIVAVVPGFVEELLFRGYLQSRLLRRWPPLLAVSASALIFSAAHLDPIHVLGVIPLGIWLGAVAWRAGSVWPAIGCHVVNNAVAVAAAAVQDHSTLELTWDPFSVTLLAIGGPAFLLSLGILAVAAPRREA